LWGRSVDRQADWSAVKHRLYRYSDEFREDSEYHAMIASKYKDLQQPATIKVIVEDSNGKKLSE
jgi:hypothetical protein